MNTITKNKNLRTYIYMYVRGAFQGMILPTLAAVVVTTGVLVPETVQASVYDCTGGNISHSNGYTIHSFTTTGASSLTCTVNLTAEVLVVGGGGSGGTGVAGYGHGGGGGGGGVIWNGAKALTATTYTVNVGAGGNNSQFDNCIASAGGRGGNSGAGAQTGFSGGSGGGGAGWPYSSLGGGSATQPGAGANNCGGTGYGNNGAAGVNGGGFSGANGGGGGGAGGAGNNAAGGAGVLIGAYLSYYGGGGGAGAGGAGGAGGGGTGWGGAGAANSGGGGGGGQEGTNGGAGGSGIVLVRYLTPEAPSNISVSPSTGNYPAGARTFSTVHRDPNGATNINYVHFLMNVNVDGNNSAFYGLYYRATNACHIFNSDNAGGWAAQNWSANVNVSGAQALPWVTLNSCSSSVNGNDLTVNWNLTINSWNEVVNQYLYTVDNAGIAVGWSAALGSVRMDTTIPTTPGIMTTTWAGDHYVTTNFVAKTTGSTDGGSGIASYSLCRSNDNAGGCSAWVATGLSQATAVTNGYTVSGANLPSNGAYRYYYWYAYDAAGNQSANSTGEYIRMDSSAPTVPAPTDDGTYSTNTSINLYGTPSDGNSGLSQCYAQIDVNNTDGVALAMDTAAVGTDGDHTFVGVHGNTYYYRYYCTDVAGNSSAWTAWSNGILVDTSAPTTGGAITGGTTGSNGWYTTNVTYTLTNADTGSGVASTVYCVDTANTCNPSIAGTSVSVTTESATNYVRWRSTDNAGNVQAIQSSGAIKIDKTNPAFSSKTTYSGWYTVNQTSTFTYTDATSGIASGNNQSCTISTEGANQTCTLAGAVNVCDAAGLCVNPNGTVSNGANIDKTAPTIPAPTDQGSYVSTTTLTFSSAPSDATSGLSACYAVIDVGNTDGAALAMASTSVGTDGDHTFVGVNDNTYYYRYYCTDTAGNISAWSNWTDGVVISIHSLTINANGGTMGGTTAGQKDYNTAITITQTPPSGYTFSGWVATNNVCSGVGDCSFNMPAYDVTVSATYATSSFTVTFDGNGATGGSTANQSIPYNTPTPLTANGYTRTYYTFTGWNTAANGSGQSYANGANYTIGAGNVTLYAQWSLDLPVMGAVSTSSVGIDRATLGATVVSGAALTARGTCYGLEVSPTGNCSAEGGTATGTFSHVRASLNPGTIYYVRGYAENATGRAYTVNTFVLTQTVPTLSAPSVLNVSTSSITMGATLDGAGGTTITARGTCWDTTSSPTNNCAPAGGTGTGAYSHGRTSLPQNTLIYVRGYVDYTDGAGINGRAYSADISTTTHGVPVLTSPSVTSVGSSQVVIGATISSNGGAGITERGTCYGTDAAPVTNCVAEGGVAVGAFTHARTGLTPETVYYMRGYATNVYGTGYSADVSTTTPTTQLPYLVSGSNQTFEFGASPSAISAITITDPSGEISAQNDIRIAIATGTVDMRWNTSDTSAVFGGSADDKVDNPVSYEGNGSVLVIPVSSGFSTGETLIVSGLSFMSFGDVNTATTALSLRIAGSGSSSVSAYDTKTVAITGTITLGDHTDGQVKDQFEAPSVAGATLFAFRFSPLGEAADVGPLTFDLHDVTGITEVDVSGMALYRDVNGDRLQNQGDVAVGGAPDVAIGNKSGTVTFSEPFNVAASEEYILVGSVSGLEGDDRFVVTLSPSDITTSGAVSGALTEKGNASNVLHIRVNKGRGGGKNPSAELGENVAPTGTTTTGGTSGEGGGAIDPNSGTTIGNEAGFVAPTGNGSPSSAWTNGGNAYSSDGSYATVAQGGAQQSYGNFNFSVPSGNTITGIEVKLEASANTAAGTVGVQLSHNGGQNFTSTKTTGTVAQTDDVYRLGGTSDTWGRAWTASEFQNGNFQIEVIGNPSGNTINLDAIQVKVYHQASGGGKGGGGAVFKEPNTFFASAYAAMRGSVAAVMEALINWIIRH